MKSHEEMNMNDETPMLPSGSHPYFMGPEPFVSATYAGSECGCAIVGAGVIPSPLAIRRCPKHDAAQEMYEALQGLLQWVVPADLDEHVDTIACAAVRNARDAIKKVDAK